ncbi:MAG TPA: BREX-2 system adenine-specific DNA-methyltransferase PglX [Streptosporangiaceae bacterium]|nr:BREX-2 system adenine-specific DNA-methyltransferase PglX [Streptosporangiaceae bacterium]
MTASPGLTSDLQRQVLHLEDDLRARVMADAELQGRWKQEHLRALEKGRTAASWTAWRDDRVTQAAVAWVVTSVFIRFCEDNALVAPVWIAGPESRRQEALDAQLTFFRAHPEDTDREWLEAAIAHLASLPATKALIDSHSALHLISPSGDAVTALLDFWRRRSEEGTLVHDLADSSLSTRFLGDLYQDLSQHAKDTYALLQTPVFVEEFILDRTLEPALQERPLEGFKLIDPTCGSGHFLLGAFDRLLDRWHRHAPGLELQARVQAALDAIHGVDLNPFAVAIARFRLTVAALKASGLTSLVAAPAFNFHLAVGDSLIHGPDPDVLAGMSDRSAFMPFTYTTEDGPLLLTMLEEGRYDLVVGNPPYITAKDKALNQIYRSKYADVCKGKYALAVPFMKLFFALAKGDEHAGWVGQITSNSFMKREFGAPLIEGFLPRMDLRMVIDSEGAWIPGHNSDGTPTVILIAKNQMPVSTTVRSVLSKGKRETRVHGNEGRGPYWTAMVKHLDDPGWDDNWITVTDLDRALLASHPWSLSGGGAVELLEAISNAATRRLSAMVVRIGFFGVMGSDEAMSLPPCTVSRQGLEAAWFAPVVVGDGIRDYTEIPNDVAWFPYTDEHNLRPLASSPDNAKWMWPLRTDLGNRATFSGGTYFSDDRPWYEWHQLPKDENTSRFSIAFAEVASHNHFVLDRGGSVFKQTAPMIKLPEQATEDQHMALLGILNSSTACFWLRQMSKAKGGAAGHLWLRTYQFNGRRLAAYPLPATLPVKRGQMLDTLAQERFAASPSESISHSVPSADILVTARISSEVVSARMIAIQEELDWETYRLYGLTDEDLTYEGDDLPGLALGERSFEIVLARAVRAGEEDRAWFRHHSSVPIMEIPGHWPTGYRNLVQRRIDLIASDPFIRLLERPEYKRRWESEPWEVRQELALRKWLLDRLEDRRFWFDAQGRPRPRSVAQLADEVARDVNLLSVMALWEGRPDVPVTQSLSRLLADEAVPYLAAYRHNDSGLRKREAWEETWSRQRREDAGERVGTIPVPPKYEDGDYRRLEYARMRGKLDVPKERFILYPEAGRETDPTALLGWAGWDHAQQSLALSLIIGDREKDGWGDEPLIPLVAGLAELQPWVEQWHGEVDPGYGVSLAAFCREQLTARAAQVGKTLEELTAWRPAPAKRGRRVRSPE